MKRHDIFRRVNTPTIRICLYVIIGLAVGYTMLSTLPIWHSQTKNMLIVDKWREPREELVKMFASEHKIAEMKLYTFTGRNGMLGVRARVNSPSEEELIKKFIIHLEPPRNIQWIFDNGKKQYAYRTDTLGNRIE